MEKYWEIQVKICYMRLFTSKRWWLHTYILSNTSRHQFQTDVSMHDPTIYCYNTALDLLLHLGHTRNRGITFSGKLEAPAELADQADFISNSSGLLAYSDSSWHKPSGELGYNMFGYFVFVFGGVVALSSAEVTCMIITLYVRYL